VDYLKYDWCFTGTRNSERAYSLMADALRSTGRDILFSICNWGVNRPTMTDKSMIGINEGLTRKWPRCVPFCVNLLGDKLEMAAHARHLRAGSH
jgi:hypothetical protein